MGSVPAIARSYKVTAMTFTVQPRVASFIVVKTTSGNICQ